MKAKLTSGEVIELTKDCSCQTHDGPHWIHMDDFKRSRNEEMIESALESAETCRDRVQAWQIEAILHRGTEFEIMRLEDKVREMRSRNIAEILRTDSKTLAKAQGRGEEKS